MIIDFHTHTYPDRIAAKTVGLLESRSGTRAHSDGTLDGLENEEQTCGCVCGTSGGNVSETI